MKVRLKHGYGAGDNPGERRFNSMKVRLKPILRTAGRHTHSQFQFHEGPIKTQKRF